MKTIAQSSWKTHAAVLFAGLIGLVGCNQNRYQPAEWRAAPRGTTLPRGDDQGANRFGSTLPGQGTTLPMGNWTTLPGRAPWQGATTLPDGYRMPEGIETMPWRNGMTTLPRLPVSDMTTLPLRQWPPKQMLPGTTLPAGNSNVPRQR